MSIPSTGELIFLSVKPLIRLSIPAGAGFLLVRTGVFPAHGTRSASALIINCTLPALLFSKIVPSFSGDNISAVGPIILTAAFYQGVCLFMGLALRAFTQTPKKFRYGFISAFVFSNWGDLPTSVVQTVCGSAPFNGVPDEDLAIAYVAIFILQNYIALFPLQGIKLIQLDYASLPPSSKKREDGLLAFVWDRMRWGKPMGWEEEEEEKLRVAKAAGLEVMDDKTEKEMEAGPSETKETKGKQRVHDDDDREGAKKSTNSLPCEIVPIPLSHPPTRVSSHPSATPSIPYHPSASIRVLRSIKAFLGSLTSPPTVSLLTALIIAIIPTLKALFIAPTTPNTFHPVAPDGQPPLAIIYTTATFLGAASVPLGLLVLGASLGKMKVPKPISRLPLASIVGMAVGKMVLMPIIGFFFVRRLTRSGMVDANNKVLRFTMVIFGDVPTATTQMAYSQLFAPEGEESNADLLAGYLLLQYSII